MSEQKLANQLEALLDEELAARGRTTAILNEQIEINPTSIIYLNRLSDLLFVMARVANKRENHPETLADFSKKRERRKQA